MIGRVCRGAAHERRTTISVGKQDILRLVRAVAGQAVEQELGRALSHFVRRLFGDGQERVEHQVVGQVIERDEGHIFGHGEVGVAQRPVRRRSR